MASAGVRTRGSWMRGWMHNHSTTRTRDGKSVRENWDFQAFVSGEVQPVLPGFVLGVTGCVVGCISTQPPGLPGVCLRVGFYL